MQNELYHHGIKGMKWGVRRYQNPDGSLTNAGKRQRSKAIRITEKELARSNKLQEKYKSYTAKNKEALKLSKLDDKKTGQHSWNTRALSDAYKVSGERYMNQKKYSSILMSDLKAFNNGTYKVGRDYIVKRKNILLTEIGIAKKEKMAEKAIKKFNE